MFGCERLNQRDVSLERWRCRQLFRLGTPLNCVRFSPANSWAHEQAKAKLAYDALKEGHDYLTEAEPAYGAGWTGKVDFVDLDLGLIREVVCSESEESIYSKQLNNRFSVSLRM